MESKKIELNFCYIPVAAKDAINDRTHWVIDIPHQDRIGTVHLDNKEFSIDLFRGYSLKVTEPKSFPTGLKIFKEVKHNAKI